MISILLDANLYEISWHWAFKLQPFIGNSPTNHISSLLRCCRSHERTADDLETIYEELLHIKALSHLSNSVKRELSSVIVFEAHPKASTICKYAHAEAFNIKFYINILYYFYSVSSRRRRQIVVHYTSGIRRCCYTRKGHRNHSA